MAVKYKRSRLLVDPAFQFRLLARMGVYFLIYVFTMLHVGFAIETLLTMADGVQRSLGEAYVEFLWKYKPLIFSFVLIAPILFYDLLKFSNRVAGPLFRCRRNMLEMAQGKPVPTFVPRQGDLMGELFAAFNVLIAAWNRRNDEKPAAVNGKPAAPQEHAHV